jgi:hypothetical protein
MSNRSDVQKNLAVVGMGMISTILTGIILGQLRVKTNVVLHSFVMLKVLPIGAIFAGCVAACGYFLGVKILHVR